MAVATATRTLTMAQAVAEAIGQEMERDPNVFVMGEDVGIYGGIFGATAGLLKRFGPERVMDTPISESACAELGDHPTGGMYRHGGANIESPGSKTVISVHRPIGLGHSIVTANVTPPSRGAMLLTLNRAAPTNRWGADVVMGGAPSLAVITTTES